MSSASLKQLGQEEVLAAPCALCAGVTLFIYDYLLTLQDEQNLIWRAQWSFGKALFLFIRYSGFLILLGLLYIVFGSRVSPLSCKVLVYVVFWAALVITLCAGLIMAFRTWAIWERSLVCAILLGVAYVAAMVPAIVFLKVAILGLEPDGNEEFPDNAGLRGCGTLNTPASAAPVLNMFVCLAVYEGVVVLMTLVHGLRALYKPGVLLSTLYRDAFVASTSLLGVTIADGVLSRQGSTDFYIPWMLCVSFYIVAPCRIILNLRAATRFSDEFDLTSNWPLSDDQHTIRGNEDLEHNNSSWSDVHHGTPKF